MIAELTTEKHWLQEPLQELATILLDQWQAEYTRLFTNDNPSCPLFESLYRQGILNGPLCSEIERIYQTIGLETVEGIPYDFNVQMNYPNGTLLLNHKIRKLFSAVSLKAHALSIHAEYYTNDKVLDDVDLLYTGQYLITKEFWNAHNKEIIDSSDGKKFYTIACFGKFLYCYFPK